MFGLIYIMNKKITKFLRNLTKNKGALLLGAAVLVYAIYSYMQKKTIPVSAMSGSNKAAGAADKNTGNSFVPSKPLGQNSNHASAKGAMTDTYGLPPSCSKQEVVDPKELLPKGDSEFAKLNPMGSGDLKNVNLLKAGWHVGINTVGQSLRNANLQLRSEPPNPQLNTGPWNQSTITGDKQRRPLEIGSH